ncbi:uncharacterized protein LY79DRAFT_318357 [Colletotrichum navitas]|uniref:Uncharacterized protein n=1 Tax=Colletotrichum navitas TaxID=681940 RepID=A0AAD8PSQ1_9PEZI|nr:uncharacterized protein LY79DRAFT_318357 [Colletotrichum navitas]KAK1580053.1 hypothetical protein LY79DRAFT_318357 [Colletotrichum navitas]
MMRERHRGERHGERQRTRGWTVCYQVWPATRTPSGSNGFAGAFPAFLSRPPAAFPPRRVMDGHQGLYYVLRRRTPGFQASTTGFVAACVERSRQSTAVRSLEVHLLLESREAVLRACKPHFRQPQHLSETEGGRVPKWRRRKGKGKKPPYHKAHGQENVREEENTDRCKLYAESWVEAHEGRTGKVSLSLSLASLVGGSLARHHAMLAGMAP